MKYIVFLQRIITQKYNDESIDCFIIGISIIECFFI